MEKISVYFRTTYELDLYAEIEKLANEKGYSLSRAVIEFIQNLRDQQLPERETLMKLHQGSMELYQDKVKLLEDKIRYLEEIIELREKIHSRKTPQDIAERLEKAIKMREDAIRKSKQNKDEAETL